MRAAVISERNGTPKAAHFDAPAARSGAVVLDVSIGAVGPTDLYKAAGTYRPYPGVHIVNGEGVGRTPDGQRRYFGHSILPYGSWAEQTLVSEEELWPIPDSVPDDQAAAIGISGTAALIALEQASIQSGDRVLVLGATGVLGQIGLQIARGMGAGTVVAAARNAQVLERLRAQGLADETVQIGRGDDLSALKSHSGGGWNVVLDIVFGKPAEAALKTSAMGARLVSVSRMSSPTMNVELVDLGFRTLSGVGTGIRPATERRGAFERLMRLAAARRLSVDVCEFELNRCADAWAHQIAGPYAKVLVKP